MLRKSKPVLEANRTTGRMFQPEIRVPGSLLSFIPAHNGSKAPAVTEELSRILTDAMGIAVLLADFDAHGYRWQASGSPRGIDGRTWGGLVSEVDGLGVLGARQVQKGKLVQLLESAREYYALVCADLTHAPDESIADVTSGSDGVFIVANNDQASLIAARDMADRLGHDRCGLLLTRVGNGLSASEAEELTGVPVCSLVDTGEQMEKLAMWLAAANRTAPKVQEFALAV